MTTAFFCGAAFLGCLLAANRSLKHGILALIGIGYIYGILRANFPDAWTYLMFDAGRVRAVRRAAVASACRSSSGARVTTSGCGWSC